MIFSGQRRYAGWSGSTPLPLTAFASKPHLPYGVVHMDSAMKKRAVSEGPDPPAHARKLIRDFSVR